MGCRRTAAWDSVPCSHAQRSQTHTVDYSPALSILWNICTHHPRDHTTSYFCKCTFSRTHHHTALGDTDFHIELLERIGLVTWKSETWSTLTSPISFTNTFSSYCVTRVGVFIVTIAVHCAILAKVEAIALQLTSFASPTRTTCTLTLESNEKNFFFF